MHKVACLLVAVRDRATRYWPVVLLVCGLLLAADWIGQITTAPIEKDAMRTARMAVNLVHHGVLSDDATSPPRPSMYREPAPAVSAAMGVVAADAALGRAAMDDYLAGDRARYLKYHHVLWRALSVAAAYWLILMLAGSNLAAFAGALLVGTSLPMVDTLYTELEAGTLLVLGMALFVAGVRQSVTRRAMAFMLAAGICFGMMALTKAAFLYVFVGFLLAVPLSVMLIRDGERLKRLTWMSALLALAFAAVTLPWMIRNYVELGSFQISGRSGVVLYTRAVKNRMTWEEYKGSFYAWSPRRVRALVGALTGYSDQDLQGGGRLQRLNRSETSDFAASDLAAEQSGNPQAAISYYRQARAERVRLENLYRDAGSPDPVTAADEALQSLSLREFREHPLRHLAMTVPFLWRGAGLLMPVLLIALVYSFRSHRRDLLLVALMASGYALLHALATHFEPRFGATLIPCVVVSGVVMLTAAWRRYRPALLFRRIQEEATA